MWIMNFGIWYVKAEKWNVRCGDMKLDWKEECGIGRSGLYEWMGGERGLDWNEGIRVWNVQLGLWIVDCGNGSVRIGDRVRNVMPYVKVVVWGKMYVRLDKIGLG